MSYFSVIQDLRIERNKVYEMHESIVITIVAVIPMAEDWENIEG
jgi:hypothetical protein